VRWLDKTRLRLRSLFRKSAVDRELDQEMRFHFERQIQENIAAGMSPDEARRATSLEFGSLQNFREECRDTRRMNFFQDVLRDIRFSLRTLRKNPGFTIVSVLTLALVIGANTAIFSAIYGLLFRSLPYTDPNRLVMLWDANRHTGQEHIGVMEGSFPILQSEAKSFTGMGAFGGIGALGSMFADKLWGTEERVSTISCTSQLFPVLGVAPFLGQAFSPRDDTYDEHGATPSFSSVAILSYTFWQQHYGASAGAIGKTLALNEYGERQEYAIIGVMPQGFDFPYPMLSEKPDVWLPYAISSIHFSPGNNLRVIARLQAGVSLPSAQAELNTISDRLQREYPKYYKSEYVTVTPLQSELIRDARTILWTLLVALGLVLLIGCANVGNLMLMRAVSREKEMAVRSALGAGRPALVRQMLTEAMLVALGGGALGFLLAHWSMHAILAGLPASIYIPRLDSVAIDSKVLVFTAIVSTIAAAFFGVLPSLRLSRPDLNRIINAAPSPDRAMPSILRRPGSLLLIGEVSLAVVLLTGTALLAKSLKNLIDVNLHFQPEHLLVMDVAFSNAYVKATPDFSERGVVLYSQFQQQVGGMPGVRSVAFVDEFPLRKLRGLGGFKESGGSGPISENFQPAEQHIVTPNFFELMGMSLQRGRWLADADTPKSLLVAVINQAMAQRYWPDSDPLGHRIAPLLVFTEHRESYAIVGIVREPKRFGTGETSEPAVYLSTGQVPLNFYSVLVRTAGDPRRLAGPLRAAALKLAPGQMFVSNVQTGSDLVSESSARSRVTAMLLTCFAGLALILGVIGIYGLISYYTAQRTREIGIRMALGATPSKVLRLVLKEGMSLVGLGVALGLILAYGFARSLASLLYGTPPADLTAFLVAAVLFGNVGLLACYIPARRAMRVDPMIALRHE
jgi:predicted permease